MRQSARRFLVILCTLALIAGSTIGFAATLTANHPCAHEHAEPGGAVPAHQHHHDHHCAGCLACCLGACSAVGQPPAFIAAAAFAVGAVNWWETAVSFSGRSIAPDPGPPRTIA